jgi:MarR family transcriptional regulator, organic hydroperoxide resistance regulator
VKITATYGVPQLTRAAYGGGMGSRRPATVDEQLCFALYTASRAMTACYRPVLDAIGLTYPQYLVMLVLWERGEAAVTAIGNALQLETGTLSPLLKRLEGLGLVARTRQADDERSVLVTLTPAGKALEAEAEKVQSYIWDAAGLSTAQAVELRETLHALTERLRAAGGS